jgi:phage tail sheath protein FI
MPLRTPILGAPTSVTAFIGRADQGPVDSPVLVTSVTEFTATFGGLSAASAMSYAVSQFFVNGGTSALVVRTAAVLPGDADAKTGMYALDGTDFNLLCIPPEDTAGNAQTSVAVNDAALAYCASRRAFLIADPPPEWLASLDAGRLDDIAISNVASAAAVGSCGTYGAVFFPRFIAPDPLNDDALRAFPPSGAIAGAIAKTDARMGVWKAAAGITDGALSGTSGLEAALNDAANGVLASRGINCLRTFPRYGNVVWGARTLVGADDCPNDYKYIPVQRLASYIENSVISSCAWSAFEPNAPPLWSALETVISAFMAGLFARGAFVADSQSGAYSVTCDATTNPPEARETGRVNVTISFVPTTPAEFVLLNIQLLAQPSI